MVMIKLFAFASSSKLKQPKEKAEKKNNLESSQNNGLVKFLNS